MTKYGLWMTLSTGLPLHGVTKRFGIHQQHSLTPVFAATHEMRFKQEGPPEAQGTCTLVIEAPSSILKNHSNSVFCKYISTLILW